MQWTQDKIKQFFGVNVESVHFGVCSRNLEIRRPDNTTAITDSIITRIKSTFTSKKINSNLKAKQSDFIKETGVSLETLIAYAETTSGKKRSHFRSYDFSKVNEESELVQSIVDLVGNYDLPTGDFTRLANWRNL